MALSIPVGALLGASTFVTGGIWFPAAIVAVAYVVAGMFVGAYVGMAGRKAASGDEPRVSRNAAHARRRLTWAGAFTCLALMLLLARNALGGGVPDAVLWIGAIALVAIGLAITALSVGQR